MIQEIVTARNAVEHMTHGTFHIEKFRKTSITLPDVAGTTMQKQQIPAFERGLQIMTLCHSDIFTGMLP
jgi:hypothetical protein